MVIVTGGLMSSNGIIMIGLLGPLFALILPNKRRALILFAFYMVLVLVLAGFCRLPKDRVFIAAGFKPFDFWPGRAPGRGPARSGSPCLGPTA